MQKLSTDIEVPPITPEFRQFIIDNLLYRCLIKPETIKKYFDTPQGMDLMMQAFMHKSYSRNTNYEMLEFEGDVILNACTVDYIRTRYPNIVSVAWTTRLKHTLVSGNVLALVALKHGFDTFAIYGPLYIEMMKNIEMKNIGKEDCEECMGMYEDIIEAFCGTIRHILDTNVVRGVGYAACYNLIESFLDEYDIPLEYENLFDSVTRLKENFFDNNKWPDFGKNVFVRDLTQIEINRYKKDMSGKLDPAILDSTDKYIAFVYTFQTGERKLLAVATSNVKKKAKRLAASKAIELLKKFGYSVPEIVAPTQRDKEDVKITIE